MVHLKIIVPYLDNVPEEAIKNILSSQIKEHHETEKLVKVALLNKETFWAWNKKSPAMNL